MTFVADEAPTIGSTVDHIMHGEIGKILSVTDTHAVIGSPFTADPLWYALDGFGKWWISFVEPNCRDCWDERVMWEADCEGNPRSWPCRCQDSASYD